MPDIPWHQVATVSFLVMEYVLKVVAIGTVPEGRRPSSSTAWLLLILLLPLIGFPLYWLLGSPYVRGRRMRIQREANQVIAAHAAALPKLPAGATPDPALRSVLVMNRKLTGLPCVTGSNDGLIDTPEELFVSMASAVDAARNYVHAEFFIMAWDSTTDVFFQSLARARERGVTVRLLLDHLGSRKYPGWRRFKRRLTKAGIDWRLMMPVLPLRGQWRRPDLRNHRKLLVVDGKVGFLGSHNLIDSAYGSKRNARIGRRWKDLSLRMSGDIVGQLEAIFATDWFTETGELLGVMLPKSDPSLRVGEDERINAMQLVPSGPGFPTEPNRHQFVQLMHRATKTLSVTSPYFIPDDSLLTAMVGAAHRGVRVDLFVSERGDQFIVGHAQRSYYSALLEAGVHIWLYPAPTVLHSKYFTVDDEVAVIGSSNMDYRSFALNYEIMLLAFGGDLVDELRANDEAYRRVSRELTLEEWSKQPAFSRYIDNACRLTSALM